MKAKQNFALPSVTSTYAGEAASGFIAAALLSARTLDNKYVTIMPNVKYKSVIQKLAVANLVNDASCDFVTNTGSVTISEQILTPKELQVNIQLCKQEFVDSWQALQLGSTKNQTSAKTGWSTVRLIPTCPMASALSSIRNGKKP